MAAVNGYQGNTPAETTPAATGSKQPAPLAKTVDSQSVLKRLQSELMALVMEGDPGISAFLKTTYSAGKEQSQVAKTLCLKELNTGSHSLSRTIILSNLPKLSLRLAASTPMWICMAIFAWIFFRYTTIILLLLYDKWSSAYDVRTILLSIQSLLGEPNISSPLNNQAAQLWSNQEEYRKMVLKSLCNMILQKKESLHKKDNVSFTL